MKEKHLPPISMSAEGLRDALFDEINSLRTGHGNIQRAKVIAQLAHRIIEAARLSLQVAGKIGVDKKVFLGSKNDSM